MTLEDKYNVPTMALHTDVFRTLVGSVTRLRGMPHARYGFVPQPVVGKSAAELIEYIEGEDPVFHRPVWQEIIEGLTVSLEMNEEDVKGVTFDRSTPRLVDPGTEEDLQELFLTNDWTDKLPIILPTEERVAAMLAGTSHKPDEVVGRFGHNHHERWEFTVEKCAINAVMAGAKPEYFPAILAMAASGVSARGTSSSSSASMAVINGPIRHEIDMNMGVGAMGPWNHANATIGRAWGLISQNCGGGSKPGLTYMGSQGNGYSYNNLTFPEHEEKSPWEPLHVQHGFKPSDSAVSLFTNVWSTAFTFGFPEPHWRDHVYHMLRGMDPSCHPCLVLDPLAAKQFIDRTGMPRKQQLLEYIYETAKMPAGEYWNYQINKNYIYPRATAGEEPYASRLAAADDELVHMYKPDQIEVVVVGGEANAYWRLFGARRARTVSIDDWR
jgi:hypothetical protein